MVSTTSIDMSVDNCRSDNMNIVLSSHIKIVVVMKNYKHKNDKLHDQVVQNSITGVF